MGGNSVIDHQLDQQDFKYTYTNIMSIVEYNLALTQLRYFYPDTMIFSLATILKQVNYNRNGR